MRVNLKGINSRRKTLADGTSVTYYWAWKGGPRIKGEFGSAEFIASYNDAVNAKKPVGQGTVLGLLQAYQASDDFRSLADRTRSDYIERIKVIEREFGDFPTRALVDPRTRGEFKAWRDNLALRSRRQADYAWTVLARVLSWSLDRGLIGKNPCEKGGRLYRGTRAENVWTDDDEARFLAAAPPHLHLPLLLALWTGQRQGDLLRLPWSAYDGTRIRLKQSKTGRRVVIPVGAPLKAALDATPRRAVQILVTLEGRPWTEDGFRSSFTKARLAAGITGVTFNDLRGTAVTRLALSECTAPEIATITGHSMSDVTRVMDYNYLHRDSKLGDSAMRKLERRTKAPD